VPSSRRQFLAGSAAASLVAMAGVDASAQTQPASRATLSGPRTILLVDDHDVLYRAGTRRVLHPLKRHASNPVIRGKEKPWEISIAWSSVHRDAKSGRYQLWYQSYAGAAAREKTHSCTISYAESADGITWEKPNLGLFAFNGINETNIVLLANGGKSDRYGASVVVDPRDPDPSRQYKLAHFDFAKDEKGEEFPGLCVAFSPDGIHWTKHAGKPLLIASYGEPAPPPFAGEARGKWWDTPLAVSDAIDVFYDPVREVFASYGKCWIDGPDGNMYWKHAAARIESRDFIHWSQPRLVMTPDELDPAYVEFHTTPTFFYNGVYFAAPQILNRADRGGVMDVELAISRDGINFSRPFRTPFWLPKSEGNAFDSGSIFTNSSPVMLDDDEFRFYYGGYSQGATGSDDSQLTTGIGLATMPRDRFAGVRPVGKIGQVTLKPIDLAGIKGITINADASHGAARVELLNEQGRRLHGFTRDDAQSISGDGLRHAVRWKDKSLTDLAPGRYMPRLHLENAEVFAVTLL
jgi:hypothetical protein